MRMSDLVNMAVVFRMDACRMQAYLQAIYWVGSGVIELIVLLQVVGLYLSLIWPVRCCRRMLRTSQMHCG